MGSTATPSGAAKSTTVTPGQSVQSEQSSRCCWTKLFLGVGIPLRLSHFMHIRLVLYGLNTSYSPTCFKLVQYVNGAAVVVWGILFACALNRWCCRCLYAEQPYTHFKYHVSCPTNFFTPQHNFHSFHKLIAVSNQHTRRRFWCWISLIPC